MFHPPLKVDMQTRTLYGVMTVCWKIDPDMFGVKILPYLGLDTKLTKLLVLFAHTYQIPGVGKVSVHRNKQGTASHTRFSNAAVYAPNIISKTSMIITDNCLECRKNGLTILEKQLVHHRMEMSEPFANIAIDLIGSFYCKASSKTRAIAKVWSLIILCRSTGMLTHQLLDTIGQPDVIRAIWNHQCPHNCVTKSIHSILGHSCNTSVRWEVSQRQVNP